MISFRVISLKGFAEEEDLSSLQKSFISEKSLFTSTGDDRATLIRHHMVTQSTYPHAVSPTQPQSFVVFKWIKKLKLVLGENQMWKMYTEICNYLEIDAYKATFETNLNKGKERSWMSPWKDLNLISYLLTCIFEHGWTLIKQWLITSWIIDEIAKEFWAKQLPVLIDKFSVQASVECEQNADSQLRVENYKQEYQRKVDDMINK